MAVGQKLVVGHKTMAGEKKASPPGSSGSDLCFYIYYRSTVENAAAVMNAFGQLQRALPDRLGLHSELLQRPQQTDGKITWMECYRGVTSEFADALEMALAATSLPALIEGIRHCEVFQKCLPDR